MSPRLAQIGVAGLLVASALAAPAAVTKTVTEVSIETQVVNANGAAAPAVPAVPAAQVQAQAAPANVAAQAAPASQSSADTSVDIAKGGKRGLLLDSDGDIPAFTSEVGNGKFSWFANWVSSDKGVSLPGCTFVPQLKTMFADVWSSEAGASIAAGSQYLMGLNEPDIASQENMDVDSAVAQWHSLMEPFSSKAKLITPSVSNSQTPGMGLDWLSSFLEQCEASGCHIHACGYHWHDTTADFEYFQNRIEAAHQVCGDKPLWITEFSADTDDADQTAFVKQATAYLDSLSYVERYAYFDASTMSSGSALNSIGEAYVSSS